MSGICERLGVQVLGPTRPRGGIPRAYSTAVLHPQSERQLSGWIVYRKVTTATCAHAFTGSNAADAAFTAQGASGPPQSNASRSLCLLRHCRKHSGVAEGASGRGAVLAQNAEQS